jgi:dipeptidyl aminopeptidase/acylaminoacyl peptidase
MPQAARFGGWLSPITAASVAAARFLLARPGSRARTLLARRQTLEGGRYVLVRRAPSGERTELTPAGFNVRTRVHEYGGGSFAIHGSTAFFSNFADQRLYRQADAGEPHPITPEPELRAGERFADGRVTADGRLLICVRERHPADGSEAINDLVALPTDGSTAPLAIASGHDFFSTPRISPDGQHLAWLTWDHPRMPWDGTQLWLGDLRSDGSIDNARSVAGGEGESIFQPEWSPSGVLHFVSDRTGWWNLYRVDGDQTGALLAMEAEFGTPQWLFGTCRYTFLDDGRIVAAYSRNGFDHLGVIAADKDMQTLDLPYTAIGSSLHASGDTVVFVGASPHMAAAVIRFNVADAQHDVLGRSVEHAVDEDYVSIPRSIAFPTENGQWTAYALYYPPSNRDFVGAEGERPPLIVESHGGPTSMTSAQLDLGVQFWTSRGFGLVDVNYGGSSGFGRPYRERLNGRWGIVDTDDCINAARYLAERGEVDGQRLAIRGGSAGGYTTLCALVFHDDFAAGASYFGVADCAALATDTHKFESRYLDGLIGPWPAARDVYYERSPIHFADRLSCPVILFQGLDDKVVPPAQAEAMVDALRAKHLPFAYLAFEGEQHGFRKAETIQRTLEAEQYFYSRVFGFPLAETVEPVEIENLPPST